MDHPCLCDKCLAARDAELQRARDVAYEQGRFDQRIEDQQATKVVAEY